MIPYHSTGQKQPVGRVQPQKTADRRAVILIPAYNPGDGLLPLVKQLTAAGRFGQLIVVNDGSRPEWRERFEQVRVITDVTLLEHAVNLGKGAALKTGLNHALCHYPNAVGVITADADGQHLSENIITVAEELRTSPQRLVLGVRDFSRKVPLRSRIGNALTRRVFYSLVGCRLDDTQTGLRGIPRQFIPDLLRIKTTGYDFELDMLIRARIEHIAVRQVPITTVYEDGNPTSHFNPVLDSLKIYFVFLRFVSPSLVTTLVSLVAFESAFRITGDLVISEFTLRVVESGIQSYLNREVISQSRQKLASTFVKFLFLVMLMSVAGYWLTVGFSHWLGIGVLPARILAALLLYLPSFSVQRKLVFEAEEILRRNRGPESSASGEG